MTNRAPSQHRHVVKVKAIPDVNLWILQTFQTFCLDVVRTSSWGWLGNPRQERGQPPNSSSSPSRSTDDTEHRESMDHFGPSRQ